MLSFSIMKSWHLNDACVSWKAVVRIVLLTIYSIMVDRMLVGKCAASHVQRLGNTATIDTILMYAV